MSRYRIILPLVLLAAVAVSAACGGGSSGASSASLESGDVAVVGDTHITKQQLDQLVTFQVNSAKVAKQKIPAAGTTDFKTQVVDPILQRMITNAQVENIAKELGVTVSDSEVNAGLQKAIQAQFGTDTAKYQAYLKKYAVAGHAEDHRGGARAIARAVGRDGKSSEAPDYARIGSCI
jgi:hypothetical protein